MRYFEIQALLRRRKRLIAAVFVVTVLVHVLVFSLRPSIFAAEALFQLRPAGAGIGQGTVLAGLLTQDKAKTICRLTAPAPGAVGPTTGQA